MLLVWQDGTTSAPANRLSRLGPVAGTHEGVWFLLREAAMRLLVVLDEPVVSEAVRLRCSGLAASGSEVAVCYVLPPQTTLLASLDAQRKITGELRHALEALAETIPVFVVSGVDGDGVDDCAREWGATEVER